MNNFLDHRSNRTALEILDAVLARAILTTEYTVIKTHCPRNHSRCPSVNVVQSTSKVQTMHRHKI